MYYRKKPTFRVDPNLTRKQVLEEVTHGFILITDAKTPDDIYMYMQGDFISKEALKKLDEARKRLGVRFHTSMSVGDCIYNIETNKVYQCADAGWDLVPSKRQKSKPKKKSRPSRK